MTHISYEVSKRLKEFLGEGAPEPMGNEIYDIGTHQIEGADVSPNRTHFPAYQLHDLLSKPFCEAFAGKNPKHELFEGTSKRDMPCHVSVVINERYFEGGLLAVERALMEMMEEKCGKN